jgi:hypothetical protein
MGEQSGKERPKKACPKLNADDDDYDAMKTYGGVEV